MSLPPCRDYQLRMVEEGSAYLRTRPTDGVLFQSATGSGKTRLALEIALRHLARGVGRRVLWLAHRDELIEQPAAKLRTMGAPVATLRPGAPPIGDARLVVASVQTLVARGPEVAPAATLVVYDECRHVADAPRWSEVARHVGEGRPRIGLDATPTGDLRPLFSHLVQGPSIRSLIDAGHLAQPIHIGPDEPGKALADHPVDAYLWHLAPHRAIVFCRDVRHAREVADTAAARGIRAAVVTGDTAADQRRTTIDAYNGHALDLLVGVNVFVDGFDAPGTAGIIIARGCSTLSTWIQMGGRALRPSPGKRVAKIVDLLGATHRLGYIDQPVPWSLDGEPTPTADRLTRVMKCPACHALGPPSTRCPGCGHTMPAPPPPTISKREMRELRQDRQPREGEEWDAFCEIVRQVRARGWKPQAATIRFKERFGHFPKWRVDMVPTEADEKGAA